MVVSGKQGGSRFYLYKTGSGKHPTIRILDMALSNSFYGVKIKGRED